MAEFRKNRVSLVLLTILLISAIAASSMGVVGCQAFMDLFFGKKNPATQDDFLKRLKGFDVPGRDLKDFPRYPGSRRISYTIIMGVGKNQSGTIVYRTYDKRAKVYDFYKKTIPAKGWTIDQALDTNDGKIYQLSKLRYPNDKSRKDLRHVSMSIAKRSRVKYTEITMIYREY